MSGSQAARRAAALRFLQTVVVVDDHAYKSPPELSAEPATLGNESIEDSSAIQVDSTDMASLDPQDFETEIVVEAFADLGIYCAVLAPDLDEQAADARRLEKLARRSDIVILDWVLRPRDPSDLRTAANGERTSVNLVREIVRDDLSDGGRTRLICIYTGAADAIGILETLASAIEEEVPGAAVMLSDGRRLDVRSTRVVVLGKERPISVQTIESVASADLPERVVNEFADFVATGLLREIALDSLSAVRDESHRLLRRFDGGLDAALLSHRAVTSPADAEQFARGLIGSELGAIVHVADVTGALADDRVNEVIDAALDGKAAALYWTSPAAAIKEVQSLPIDVAKKALKLGVDEKELIHEVGKKLLTRVSRTPLLLSGEAAEVRAKSSDIDARFSMLSSLARDPAFDGAGSVPPVMQLGTIVSGGEWLGPRTEEDEEKELVRPQPSYWVCLQPLCDSVRLSGETVFPMLPLKLGGERFNYVVMSRGAPLMLQHRGLKLRELDLLPFAPRAGAQVVDAIWNGQVWSFVSADGTTYEWAGSLRLDKAHKLLHSVVNVAGRIGIDEYDYLRQAAPS